MEPRIRSSEFAKGQLLGALWALALIMFLTFALGVPTRSQEAPSSLVQAARNARERQSESSKPAKIYTNDDITPQSSLPGAAALPAEPSLEQVAATPSQQAADCNNPDDERLKGELQATEEELDQLRRELNSDPKVISDGDVDLRNFKPGSSGLNMGSPPLMQTEPQAPARVQEVMLEERVKSLKQASRIVCYSTEDAGIQRKIDSAEDQLKLLQREFELDSATYYSKTGYANDTSGKAKLDAEQQQIESLQSEIERLKHELPAPKTNQ